MIKKTYSLISNEKGDAYISDAVKIVIAIVCASIVLSGFFAIMASKGFPAIQKYLDKAVNKNESVLLSETSKKFEKLKLQLKNDLAAMEEDDDFKQDWNMICEVCEMPTNTAINIDNYFYMVYLINYCDDTENLKLSTQYKTQSEFSEYIETDEGKEAMLNIYK